MTDHQTQFEGQTAGPGEASPIRQPCPSMHSETQFAEDRLTIPIWNAVMAERDRQDARWGGTPGIDRRDDHTYAAVLGEEFGEVCKAWLERDMDGLRTELIQTAAVALAWVEELDNGGAKPRD